MTHDEVLTLLSDDPFARELLTSRIPARLAYIALDCTPRAIPIAFHFNGNAFVLATPDIAPKVAALQANPAVALTIDTETQPPLALLIRGIASLTFVDGVVPEYLEANRRMMPEEAWEPFEQQVTSLYDRMARIERWRRFAPSWCVEKGPFPSRSPQRGRKCLTSRHGHRRRS